MKKMNNDYTMGNRIQATNWTEYIAVCKGYGLKVGGKKFAELEAEMEVVLAEEAKASVPVAPIAVPAIPAAPASEETKDTAAEETAAPVAEDTAVIDINNFVIEDKYGDAIVRRLMLGGRDRNGKGHGPAAFVATKSKDPVNNGRLMVTMAKLFATIGDVYGLKKEDPNSDLVIKGVIQTLCRNGFLKFKKYKDGGMVFFPTEWMAYKAIQLGSKAK